MLRRVWDAGVAGRWGRSFSGLVQKATPMVVKRTRRAGTDARGEGDLDGGDAAPRALSLRQVLRSLLRLLRTERKWKWCLVLALAVVASGAEAVAALMIFGLLGMVTGSEGSLALPVVGNVNDLLPSGFEPQMAFVVASVVIAAFFAARAVLLVVQTYVQHRIVLHTGVRLSNRLFAGYLAMPYEFHVNRNSSELIRNCHDTINLFVSKVLNPATRLCSEALLVAGVVIVLLWTAPAATVLAVGLLGLTALVLLRVVHPKLDRLGTIHQSMVSRAIQSLQQGLAGIREIRILGCRRYFTASYAATRGELARTGYWQGTLSEIPRVAMEAVLVFFIVGFFVFAVLRDGTATNALPVLGVFAYAGLRLKPSMTVIVGGLNSIQFAGRALTELNAEIDLLRATLGVESERPVEPLPFERELRLERVSFTYGGTDRSALRDIAVCIRPGEAVGIVGSTGAGKSTLLDLLLGLLSPADGRITVDGRDIHQHLPGWHRQLGVVPQSVFLTDDTLRRNIAFGLPDRGIDDDKVRWAVSLSQLTEFTEALPKGLDTEIGERGTRVSGGQRQRIAIARALYRDPSVLVFDEGTSALDNRTEAEFMEALRRLRGNRTVIMVAHRLSTVRDCDQIIVIERGEIAQVGRYDELLAQNGAFRQLADRSA